MTLPRLAPIPNDDLKRPIPFVPRILPKEEQEPLVIAHEILRAVTMVDPELRMARIRAKKGVTRLSNIGTEPVAPFEQRMNDAMQVADRFMTQAWFDDVANAIRTNMKGKSKLILVYPCAYEGASINLLPPTIAISTAQRLKTMLPGIDISINRDIFQASKANRTIARDIPSRFARQQIFTGPVANDCTYLLLDEHLESGATLRNLDSYIRQHQGHVAAIAALTKNPTAEQLRIRPSTLKALDEACPPRTQMRAELEGTLAKIGLSLPTLTNTEGLRLFAYLSRDKAAFNALLRDAGTDLTTFNVMGNDDTTALLDAPTDQKTVAAFSESIAADLGKNYQYFSQPPATGR